MDSKGSLFVFVLCFVAHFRLAFSVSGQQPSFESVPDLEKYMYTEIEGYPCVRLLNISGEIGCSNPGRGIVVAPIVRFNHSIKLIGSSTILVSADEFENLLLRVSTDADFSGKVAGVLVESIIQAQNGLKGNSPDVKFPQAQFAPYKSNNFEWNPTGSGIMLRAYDFPVFLLFETSTSTLQEVVSMNKKSKKTYTEDVVEFDLVMQTTKSGTRDSNSCLKEGTCLPLGGYRYVLKDLWQKCRILWSCLFSLEHLWVCHFGVWSAIPPFNISASPKSKPILLIMTSMDSASFFRDKSLGADSPISGLITLLAAVDALSRLDRLDDLNVQLVFVVLTGEAWGYLGSRRFLLEAEQNSDAVEGLELGMVDMVMEIGSVGKSLSQGTKTFFAHTAGATSSVNKTLDALRRAQDSLITERVVTKMASKSNPGIPPSSLMSFLRKKPQTSGFVLEDFDAAFTNHFYHSHLDDLSNINSSAIVAAASLVARTLYILSNDNDSQSDIGSVKVNASLVDELLGCLLNCDPGLSCDLVKQYISPSTNCPSHYVGVIVGEPSASPYPGYVGDVSRFVWNFLADKTSMPSKNVSSACPKSCNSVGEMCIKQETDGQGACVISTTRYVPAYSTRLKYESGSWAVLPPNSSDIMEAEDPVWTESNWDTIRVRMYTVQTSVYDRLILLLGIVITLFAYLLVVSARTFIRKALKQD